MEVIIHVAIHSIYAFEIPLISQLKMGYLYTGFDFWHLLQLVQRVAKAIAEKTCNALLLKVHFDQAISNLEIIRCVWSIQWFTCDMQQVNQIGSVTESIEAVKMSKRAGWGVMTSHRRYPLVLFPSLSFFFLYFVLILVWLTTLLFQSYSGETEDTFIADLAVGLSTVWFLST